MPVGLKGLMFQGSTSNPLSGSHQILIKGAEMVPEMLVIFNQQAWLIGSED
jgi:hypothetical protein